MQRSYLHACLSCVLTSLPVYVMFCLFTRVSARLRPGWLTTGHWPQVAKIWRSLLAFPLMLLSAPQHTDLRETDREQAGKMAGRGSQSTAVSRGFSYDSFWVEN